MKFSGKNPALRVAAKRYKKPFGILHTWNDTANIQHPQTLRSQPHILAHLHFSNRDMQPHLKM
jgi:hypothetical protein